jgi:uncharacterized protein
VPDGDVIHGDLPQAAPPIRALDLYDPLYGSVRFPELIWDAVNLPTFQRLRRVKQLSTAYLVFPSAHHTRFEHSLGACHLAGLIYETLRQKTVRREIDADNLLLGPIPKFALQFAALFHDIGHGPFGHPFDLFARSSPEAEGLEEHETRTAKLITEGLGGLHDVPEFLDWARGYLARKWPDDPALVLVEPKNIARLANGEAPTLPEYTFLANIVSGLYDADRLDYLRRDAFFTGVETGAVDIWEIVNSYTLQKEGTSVVTRLGRGAAGAVESLFMLRDLTYRRVYYHQDSRCAQALLVRAMAEVGEMDNHPFVKLAMLGDDHLLDLMATSNSEFAKDVSARIRFRRLYERIPVDVNLNELSEQARSGWAALAESGWSAVRAVEEELARSVNIPPPGRILVDFGLVPAVRYDQLTAPVFVDEDDTEAGAQSIIALLPHMKTRFGGDSRGAIAEYVRQVSPGYVFYPFNGAAPDLATQLYEVLERVLRRFGEETIPQRLKQEVEVRVRRRQEKWITRLAEREPRA